MFETLSEKLQRVFKNLRGEGKITEHRSIQSFATMFAQVGATMPK